MANQFIKEHQYTDQNGSIYIYEGSEVGWGQATLKFTCLTTGLTNYLSYAHACALFADTSPEAEVARQQDARDGTTAFKEKWLGLGAVIPVDCETTAALLKEVERLRALNEQPSWPCLTCGKKFSDVKLFSSHMNRGGLPLCELGTIEINETQEAVTTEPKVTHATVRESTNDTGEACWDIECRFSDDQKFAAIQVDGNFERLATSVAALLRCEALPDVWADTPEDTAVHAFKGDPLNDDHYDSADDQNADLKAEVARLLERNTDLILGVRPVLERELEQREKSGLPDYIKEVADVLAIINKE